MSLHRNLALDLAERHPDEAAAVLEALPPEEAASFLAGLPAEVAAKVLRRTTAHPAAAVLALLDADHAAAIVERLAIGVVGPYLRRMDESDRDPILAALPKQRAISLRSLLRFPENTAGALMDPEVLALPEDLTVSDAIERVRSSAEHARYNLYVVDRDDTLVGVLNMRELMLARSDQTMRQIMHPDVIALSAETDWRTLVEHHGWQEVHALPVVDHGRTYLGAVRYKTLRRLEAQTLSPASERGATAEALGDLFQAGLTGVIEALAVTPNAQRANRNPSRGQS